MLNLTCTQCKVPLELLQIKSVHLEFAYYYSREFKTSQNDGKPAATSRFNPA